MRLRSIFLPALMALALAATAPARAADAPYEVVIWADAKYDATGALASLEFQQADDYAPALLANLRTRITARPTEPKLAGDTPATFETGVRVTLTVTPETGSVAVDEIVDMPRVVRMTQARFTEDSTGVPTWDGRVVVRCKVSVKGRCGTIEVVTRAGEAPAEALRIAKTAMSGWRFEPQKIGGKAVEGEAVVAVVMERTGVSRPQLRDRQY
jgi:hypothetical protein